MIVTWTVLRSLVTTVPTPVSVRLTPASPLASRRTWAIRSLAAARTRRLTSLATGAPENTGMLIAQEALDDRPRIVVWLTRRPFSVVSAARHDDAGERADREIGHARRRRGGRNRAARGGGGRSRGRAGWLLGAASELWPGNSEHPVSAPESRALPRPGAASPGTTRHNDVLLSRPMVGRRGSSIPVRSGLPADPTISADGCGLNEHETFSERFPDCRRRDARTGRRRRGSQRRLRSGRLARAVRG